MVAEERAVCNIVAFHAGGLQMTDLMAVILYEILCLEGMLIHFFCLTSKLLVK